MLSRLTNRNSHFPGIRNSPIASLALLVTLVFPNLVYAQAHRFPQGEFPLTEFSKASVGLEEILSGGPPRDGIPAIDEPVHISVDAAAQWLDAREPVIAFTREGLARAYPLQILMYHEIVNDEVAGLPVAVTFCPLCNASIVYQRTVGEGVTARVLDFGTTGRLRKSDLVMYDRQTETWWQQFTGRGIIGTYTDVQLKQLPSQIVSFGQFADNFPAGEVLSRDTGFNRPYGNNPYRGYDAIDSNPFLFVDKTDPRLPPMERVLSLGVEGDTRLVPLSPLLDTPILNLSVGDKPVVVLAASTAASALDRAVIAESRAIPAAAAFSALVDGKPLRFALLEGKIVDQQTGSHWNVFGQSIGGRLEGVQLAQVDRGVHFAFAWLAFDPGATIVAMD